MKSRSYLRLRVAAVLGLLVTLSGAPSAFAMPLIDRAPAGEAIGAPVNLAPALVDDGSYVGAQNLSGSVDTSEWTLVSDLAKAEPPRFERTTGAVAGAIAPNTWSALGGGGTDPFFGALNSHVYAIAVDGADVYVGGNFGIAGIPAANFVAKWNGSAWSALPNGTGGAPLNGPVYALLFADGVLYVGGQFSDAAGDLQADNVAKWTGGVWSDIANATSGNGAIGGQIYALAKNGNNLYVGGFFNNAPVFEAGYPGTNPGDMILRWDGAAWQFLGINTAPNPDNGWLNGTVRALVATPNGVIAGGLFGDIGGDTSFDYLAEFDLTNGWSKFHGVTPNSHVYALHQSGSNMYVGGAFTDFNGIAQADYLARWTGTQWTALGGGNGISAIQARVYAIVGSPTNLFVGGDFVNAGGDGFSPKPTADRVAKWNGSTWSGLGSNGSNDGVINQGGEGDQGWVRALGMTSNALYVGGVFRNVAAIQEADYIAAYGLGAVTNQKPDGRIKLGSGSYAGNNIYNTTGVNQTRTGSATAGSTLTFTISIQNDGTQGGKFKVAATASGNVNYQIKYFRGTTEISSAVVAGTYVTGSVPVGSLFNITVKAKVLSAAVVGSTANRLITITSNANATKIDAVKLIAKRK